MNLLRAVLYITFFIISVCKAVTYKPLADTTILYYELPTLSRFPTECFRYFKYIVRDTVVNNKQYYKCFESAVYYDSYTIALSEHNGRFQFTGYLREDTLQKRVYFISDSSSKATNAFVEEQLLYDFSLRIGDTFPSNKDFGLNNSTDDRKVASIDSIEIDSTFYQRINLISGYSIVQSVGLQSFSLISGSDLSYEVPANLVQIQLNTWNSNQFVTLPNIQPCNAPYTPFPEDTAVWEYKIYCNVCTFWTSLCYSYSVIGDTLIHNKRYMKMYGVLPDQVSKSAPVLLYRNDVFGRRVYGLINGSDKVILDFNLEYFCSEKFFIEGTQNPLNKYLIKSTGLLTIGSYNFISYQGSNYFKSTLSSSIELFVVQGVGYSNKTWSRDNFYRSESGTELLSFICKRNSLIPLKKAIETKHCKSSPVTFYSIDDEKRNKIEVYPNPATHLNELTISSSNDPIRFIEVLDVTGAKVFSIRLYETTNKYILKSSELPAGILFIKINTDYTSAIKKQIIE